MQYQKVLKMLENIPCLSVKLLMDVHHAPKWHPCLETL